MRALGIEEAYYLVSPQNETIAKRDAGMGENHTRFNDLVFILEGREGGGGGGRKRKRKRISHT